ncbi:MAG TPA: PEP/pyruvate-binding domain-containing protein, partial [Myxococcota bacterium]|nr:PEP/pyruvate-binding domain-containing protein [Myxococcota bacterium]
RQGTLSHLNVRSSSRGTPNCYIRAPLETLLPWKDQLIRFECGSSNWSAAAAGQEEAEAFWSDLRPDPVSICSPDYSVRATPGLLEAQTDSAEQRRSNLCSYGSKGSNLATLYQRIAPDLQLSGFMIPFAFYEQFMEEGTWQVDLGSGLASHSFAETIVAWHEDPVFLTDAGIRSQRLEALRTAMMAAPVSPDILEAVAEKVRATWGNDTTMARVRSSSNAEDSLDFSGAGLYESTSICLADELDSDTTGPSRCDPDKEQERPVADGLKEVWASLWGLAPWEERAWYGIDHTQVAMGVLCDDRYNNEQANIVAFSGNPTAMGDWRYLINAQTGDLEVVSAEPGIYPEKVLLTVGAGGVTKIERISSSSEVDQVLSDAQLQELGEAFYEIVQVYPMDYPLPEGGELLWDT